MYPISPLYADYLRRLDREFIVKATVHGEEYDSSKIVDFTIENSLSLSSGFEIGNAIPSKLIIKLRTNETIPANARIVPYLSLTTAGLTWLEATYPWLDTHVPWTGTGTDWMPLGEFFVDGREKVNDVWTFTCYDKLVFADELYVSSLTYPATMQAIWNEIMQRMGWTSDSSVVINPSYVIQVGPAGFTCRQMMAYIASANSASVFIGKDGVTKFKRFLANAAPVFEIGAGDYSRVKQTNPVKTFTRVVIIYNTDDGLSYEAGSGDNNRTLQLTNPFATQAMADGLLAALNGFAYLPVVIEGIGYPQLEHGDVIGFERYEGSSWLETVTTWSGTDIPWNGIVDYQTLIMHQVFTFAGGLRMTIEAPSQSEQQSEFPARGTLKTAIDALNKSALREGKDYFGMTVTREAGLYIEREDHSSDVVLNSDKFAFRAGGQDKIYFDPVAGRYKFNGTLEATDGMFSGNLSAVGGTFTGALVAATGTFKGALQAATGTFSGDLSAAGGTFKGALQAASGSFAGELIAATGSFSGDLNAAGGTFRGALQAASGTFSGDLSAAGGTFTGNLSAAGGTFTGALVAASGSFSGAITASSFSGGTITGALIRTSPDGERIEVTPTGLRSYDSSGVKRVSIANDGRGHYGGVGFWDESGQEIAGMYANVGFSFVYADGPLQILSFSDRTRLSGDIEFTSPERVYGLRTTSIEGLQAELNSKANASESGYNLGFDLTTRNLKLFGRTGALLAQVNIPK
ncbi:hypothetical protein [Paenibacillus donghaensis]|uniref:Prophage tail endopeptidase domain-containing protein n=1 Tax=Paenibacillus donghaensis TaxID=414771 RepID=A0A2Z2KGH9_9BACL|nr:hypothetical protein [Paenibacillus donghaensis]ASA22313.1 hypothetical protein B9T62_16880 [Paenibacillus donghaensis]